jgi:hypothetical protein
MSEKTATVTGTACIMSLCLFYSMAVTITRGVSFVSTRFAEQLNMCSEKASEEVLFFGKFM